MIEVQSWAAHTIRGLARGRRRITVRGWSELLAGGAACADDARHVDFGRSRAALSLFPERRIPVSGPQGLAVTAVDLTAADDPVALAQLAASGVDVAVVGGLNPQAAPTRVAAALPALGLVVDREADPGASAALDRAIGGLIGQPSLRPAPGPCGSCPPASRRRPPWLRRTPTSSGS